MTYMTNSIFHDKPVLNKVRCREIGPTANLAILIEFWLERDTRSCLYEQTYSSISYASSHSLKLNGKFDTVCS